MDRRCGPEAERERAMLAGEGQSAQACEEGGEQRRDKGRGRREEESQVKGQGGERAARGEPPCLERQEERRC
jgi:hypothetical protein